MYIYICVYDRYIYIYIYICIHMCNFTDNHMYYYVFVCDYLLLVQSPHTQAHTHRHTHTHTHTSAPQRWSSHRPNCAPQRWSSHRPNCSGTAAEFSSGTPARASNRVAMGAWRVGSDRYWGHCFGCCYNNVRDIYVYIYIYIYTYIYIYVYFCHIYIYIYQSTISYCIYVSYA